MPLTKTLVVAFLFGGVALASNPLTTIAVCPASKGAPTCTVTAQHQSVSTCVPTTKGGSVGYSTSTWAYVSTVIPCGWDGKKISSCTVTKTDQPVPCSASVSTVTSVIPITTTLPGKNSTKPVTTYSTSYQTISRQWEAPYNKLGPLAIPGYDGCDLCTECAEDGEGNRKQNYQVTECQSGNGKAASCKKYAENRVSSKSASGSSTPVTATNSIKTSVPSAGSYTFTFTNTAPAATVTSDGNEVTIPAQPWFNYETKTFDGPTDVDYTVTATKTIFVNVPFSTSADTSATPVDPTEVRHWGDWSEPASTPADITNSPAGPTGASFVIPVDSSSGNKYSKGGNQFIGFNGGDDGSVVTGKENAAQFSFDSDGNLICDGQYVSTSTNAGYLVFEKTSEKPSGSKFNIGGDGSFSLPGAGFCYTDSTFFITFSGSPNGCKAVTCNLNGNSGSSSSSSSASETHRGWDQWVTSTLITSTTTASTTTTESSTTTTAADPSADLDWENWPSATAKAIPRRRGGMIRKRMA